MTTTETIAAPTTMPARNRRIRPGVLAIAATIGLGAGFGIGALTSHHPAPAPDAATVEHTVQLPNGSSVVVQPGQPLPASVVDALRDPHGAFEVGLRLERVTNGHVLLVQAHGGKYASIDPLASGSGVVVADTPVADLAVQEAREYVTAHATAPDGFPWQVVDLTR